jgi:glutamate synthase domain-containing protein 1
MCGIVGYVDKRGGHEPPVGETLLTMLQALSCRGPDSAGVAVFGQSHVSCNIHVKLPERLEKEQAGGLILAALRNRVVIVGHKIDGAYLCVQADALDDPGTLEDNLLAQIEGVEIVSLGHQLEIFKQVGSPDQLEKDYRISTLAGSHGIGHTRLSTESRVDLSHSQPFWAHGVPDLATVHNGHITNYHKLRRQYEQHGYRFYTENDSEVIGVYLRDRLAAGLTLEDALRCSLDDFDGSFSYLAASGDRLAYVRDRFGFKPLVVAETEEFVAVATEEIAIRRALGEGFVAKEPAPGTMKVWQVPALQTLPAR